MNRTSIIIALVIAASTACAAAFQVKAEVTTHSEDARGAVFLTNVPKIVVSFTTTGSKPGDNVRGVWIADDVGDAAPANTKIDEATITIAPGSTGGTFSVTKPTKDWPAGKYHLAIYANDEVATTVPFKIDEMEKAEKRDAAEHAEKTGKHGKASDDAEDDTQYSFKVHNGNVQRITKLLVSEDGKDYSKFDIGDGIEVGETVTLNWDKSTNNAGCKWYIKAVYADKSVGEAVRFNFCEEDLVIDF